MVLPEDPCGARVLYLSYDGMTDPLGQSQVLPYLLGLSARGHSITLISCEKPGRHADTWAEVRASCAAAGISWHPLRYTKRPPILATLRDLAAMRRTAFALHRIKPFNIVHCRSYLTALIGLSMKRRRGVRFLFDMRGFWVEERVERGIWPSRNVIFDRIIAFFKRRETDFLMEADAIVTLTRAAADDLAARRPRVKCQCISVIPCCVDFALFDRITEARARGRHALGLDRSVPLMVYLGSLGGAYLLDEMLHLFSAFAAVRPGARFLFLTHHAATEIVDRPAAQAFRSAILVRSALRANIPELIAAADVGVSFILPSYCAVATSPTKLGEMLAMGVKVVANRGVGDVAELLDATGTGVAIDSFDQASLEAAVAAVEQIYLSPGEIRDAARRSFSLKKGVEMYGAIYTQLMTNGRTAPHGGAHPN